MTLPLPNTIAMATVLAPSPVHERFQEISTNMKEYASELMSPEQFRSLLSRLDPGFTDKELDILTAKSQVTISFVDWRSFLDWLAGRKSHYEEIESLHKENTSLRQQVEKLENMLGASQIDPIRFVPTQELPQLSNQQPLLEESLRASLDADGFLSDLVQRTRDSLAQPEALSPFEKFGYKLYSSTSATAALRALLQCELPGTGVSFQAALSAIQAGSSPTGVQQHHCYLVGGQVRDVLRGTLSKDVDVNYTCEAREVALIAARNGWPTKFFRINVKEGEMPNYCCIGDTGTGNYLEGFRVTFNATKPCYIGGDFRQNMCYYDLTNDVIIDKTGFSVSDIRTRALRLSCADAPGETFEMWASESITPGYMQLRFVKFLLRAIAKGQPLKTDSDELAFVIQSLRAALKTNVAALIKEPLGFGYALSANLKDAKGVSDLRAWVCENGGEEWWQDSWVPLVRACGGGAFVETQATRRNSQEEILAQAVAQLLRPRIRRLGSQILNH
eukprot:TRINITY_DN61584_c0_g1_i1.p1 TRINITY_DN61584_c0_g1~~TRINITY_DN61584_c0_g1_i1.p1  ORF type:complete len:503 (+),score=52.98 TRINITY_DN61584_c0_g1_i1:8-1516(+)